MLRAGDPGIKKTEKKKFYPCDIYTPLGPDKQ